MKCEHKGECFGACVEQKAPSKMVAGDKVVSRLTGKTHTVAYGPLSNGKVPKGDTTESL